MSIFIGKRGFMVNVIFMPALSPTMEVGTIVNWLKQEGDLVAAGDHIAEIETDKATMEVEAPEDGVLYKILVQVAQAVKVKTPIALITAEGEKLSTQQIDALAAKNSDDKAEGVQKNEACAGNFVKADVRKEKGDKLQASSGSLDKEMDFSQTPVQELSVREALNQAMMEEMERDENVFLLGEEVAQYQGAYKISQGLLERFGERRVIDTPITEYGFTGLAVGAAFAGLRPIVEFMTFNFALQAIDHIINSASKTYYMTGGEVHVPIVFRGPNGAAARVGAQHSQCYAAWYSHVPGLKVVMPYSAADAKGLLKSAIRDENPVVFLENELLYNYRFPVPETQDLLIPIGKGKIYRKGADVTIASFGIGMHYVGQALEGLAACGIDAEIIDLRSLRPLDLPLILNSVKKTGRLIVVEEGFPYASIGCEIATRVMQEAFDYLDAPVITIVGKDVPMPYAANLEKLALPQVEEIVTAAKTITYKI